MDKGYIKLSRTFFDNEIWQAARAFSDCEAWLDLIQAARFEASPTTSRIGSYEVTWGRGQYPASNRFLARKWGRSEQWVKSFLGKLKRKGMIKTDNSQGINVITLVNYDKYNGSDNEGENKGNNPPNNPPNNPLNGLSDSDLQRLITHLLTHLTTHPLPFEAENEGENGVNNPPFNPLNELSDSDLQKVVTHPVTHSISNEGKEQPTPNPKTKKEEEYIQEINKLSPKREKETSPDGEAKNASPSLAGREKERIDWNGLMELFNTTFKGKLPAIRFMTDTRKKEVRNRIAQYGKEAVMEVFRNVLDSPFLLGDNDRGWKCDFDWIFKQTNFTKILEKRYNGKRTDTNQAKRESVNRLKDLSGAILRGAMPEDD